MPESDSYTIQYLARYRLPDGVEQPREIFTDHQDNQEVPVELVLPPDVLVYPTVLEVQQLLDRMNNDTRLLDTYAPRGARAKGKTRTEPAPVMPAIFGDKSTLVALDTRSLDNEIFQVGNVVGSNALPAVKDLIINVPSMALVPPVFLNLEQFAGLGKRIGIMDGHHRFNVAKEINPSFLLVYVPTDQLDKLNEAGVRFRKVTSTKLYDIVY